MESYLLLFLIFVRFQLSSFCVSPIYVRELVPILMCETYEMIYNRLMLRICIWIQIFSGFFDFIRFPWPLNIWENFYISNHSVYRKKYTLFDIFKIMLSNKLFDNFDEKHFSGKSVNFWTFFQHISVANLKLAGFSTAIRK